MCVSTDLTPIESRHLRVEQHQDTLLGFSIINDAALLGLHTEMRVKAALARGTPSNVLKFTIVELGQRSLAFLRITAFVRPQRICHFPAT